MKKKDKILIGIFFSILFILMFITCYYVQYTPDDYNYSHIAWTNDKISNFTEIIISQIKFYKLWSGRILFSGIGQLLLYLGQFVYAILNSLIFVALIYCIGSFFKKKTISYIIAFFLVWRFVPTFAEDTIWISGSVNYLWPTCAAIMFLYLFSKVYIFKEWNSKYLKYIIPILAFITGASHEMVLFVTGSFALFYVIFNFKEVINYFKTKNISFIVTVVLFILGAILLIASPGNFNRTATATGSFENSLKMILDNLFGIKYLLLATLITLIIVFIKNKDEFKKYIIYFIAPVILGLTPMLFIKEFPARTMFIVVIFLIIPLTKYLTILFEKIFIKRKAVAYIIIIPIVLYVPIKVAIYYGTYLKSYKEDILFATKWYEYSEYDTWVINDIELPTNISTSYLLTREFTPISYSNAIPNTYFCIYYDCEEVISKRKGNIVIEINYNGEDDVNVLAGNNTYGREQEWIIMPGENNIGKTMVQIPEKYINDFKIITSNEVTEVKIYSSSNQYNYEDINSIVITDI